MKSVKILAILMLVIMAMMGCESGCYENRTSLPQAALYAYNKPDNTITIDSISVYGIGQQSGAMIVDCGRRISSFALPFRIDADTTQFVIRYDAKALANQHISDTLTIAYERYPHFISADCGVAFNYIIEDFHYTTHMLDSAALMVDEVTNIEEQTLRLYYYVAQ